MAGQMHGSGEGGRGRHQPVPSNVVRADLLGERWWRCNALGVGYTRLVDWLGSYRFYQCTLFWSQFTRDRQKRVHQSTGATHMQCLRPLSVDRIHRRHRSADESKVNKSATTSGDNVNNSAISIFIRGALRRRRGVKKAWNTVT